MVDTNRQKAMKEEPTMRLKYTGPHTEGVEIPELGIVVAQDEIIEVDDDIGKRLATNPDWQVTSRTSKKGGDGEG